MQWLKQSTAVTLLLGPFLDETDGKTAETALTLAQADVRLSKNGGNMAQKNEATSCTHDELGYYGCPVDTTDTNTLGRLMVMVHESGALPVWQEFMVVPANVWDSLFGADYLQVDAVQIEGVDATNQIGDAVNDEVVEGALTVRHVLRVLLAGIGGKASGGGTTSIAFRDQADSKNRISATVDANGNRTAVTVDGA